MRCKIKIKLKLKAACGSGGTAKDGEYQALGH
jgi:translation initiation factor 1 (eIF-1/SUI1)